MAIEDAAALGILFSKKYFRNVSEALAVYEQVRLPRATRVQAAAAKAAYNINERIGKFRDALAGYGEELTMVRIFSKQGHCNISS